MTLAPHERALPGWRQTALLLLLFTALAVFWTWPLTAHLSSRIPHDPGDPVLNTWILWWNAQALPFTNAWWNAPFMYPMRGALALSEHLAGVSVIATPVLLGGGSPLAAYNVALLTSYALSGFFASLLVRHLSGSMGAGVCAGVAFAFAPYRAGQLAHIQVISSQWMPAMLLAMHAYMSSRRRGWLGAFAVAWLLQALSNGYYLLFLPVLVVLWLAWFVDWGRARREGLALAATWLAASLLLVPALIEYRNVHDQLGLVRSAREIQRFSATAASFLHAPPLLRIWPAAGGVPTDEDYLFPGVAAIVLIGAGLVASVRRGNGSAARSPLVFYACAAVVMFACALGPGDGTLVGWLKPYSWIAWLPGYDALRVPARFAMLGSLCLAIGAGLAAAALTVRRGFPSHILMSLAVAGLALDGLMEPMPLVPPPPRGVLPDTPPPLVLELPPDDTRVNVAAMYRSMFHRRPLVNGYSGHTPPHYAILSRSLSRGDGSPLIELARGRPLVVLVDGRYDPGGFYRSLVETLPGVVPHGTGSAGAAYVLPAQPRLREVPLGQPLDLRTVEAGLERLEIDLGSPHDISEIEVPLRWRYPRIAARLTTEASEDGVTWTEVWRGWTGGLAFTAAVEDPQRVPLRIPLAGVRARYLRIHPARDWMARGVVVRESMIR